MRDGDVAKVEAEPLMEGRQMVMVLAPQVMAVRGRFAPATFRFGAKAPTRQRGWRAAARSRASCRRARAAFEEHT